MSMHRVDPNLTTEDEKQVHENYSQRIKGHIISRLEQIKHDNGPLKATFIAASLLLWQNAIEMRYLHGPASNEFKDADYVFNGVANLMLETSDLDSNEMHVMLEQVISQVGELQREYSEALESVRKVH